MNVERALLSVADKTGIVVLGRALAAHGAQLVSTGGTRRALQAAGVATLEVAAVTGFPEIMDGRVKTLHPKIHGGILARRGQDDATLAAHDIDRIDLVVVNLYPFEKVVAQPRHARERAIENIDVGGPAMLRAAAKNHDRVAVVTDPSDYPAVAERLANGLDGAYRLRLAAKAFALTAAYDAAVSRYLRQLEAPP